MTTRITIRKPDDWHLHVRDSAMLKAVLPYTARNFGRAILMPNLIPPVRTTADAVAYRARVMSALPAGSTFKPLMTCYLTDDTDPDDVERGFGEGGPAGRRHHHALSHDPHPHRHAGSRDQALHVLHAGREDGEGPPGAAQGRDLGRGLLFPWHRLRAASGRKKTCRERHPGPVQ